MDNAHVVLKSVTLQDGSQAWAMIAVYKGTTEGLNSAKNFVALRNARNAGYVIKTMRMEA